MFQWLFSCVTFSFHFSMCLFFPHVPFFLCLFFWDFFLWLFPVTYLPLSVIYLPLSATYFLWLIYLYLWLFFRLLFLPHHFFFPNRLVSPNEKPLTPDRLLYRRRLYRNVLIFAAEKKMVDKNEFELKIYHRSTQPPFNNPSPPPGIQLVSSQALHVLKICHCNQSLPVW